MKKYEKSLYKQGYKLIAGLDEVGRGCIAGPLVCAIVILPTNYSNVGIRDSKQLTSLQRQKLCVQIKKDAIAFHIEFVDKHIVEEINPKKLVFLECKHVLEK